MPGLAAHTGRTPTRGGTPATPRSVKTFDVQHERDSAKTEEVIPVVSGIIGSAQIGRLPVGFSQLGVVMSKEAPKAYRVWQSESKASFEGLIPSVVPPTRHSVSELEGCSASRSRSHSCPFSDRSAAPGRPYAGTVIRLTNSSKSTR